MTQHKSAGRQAATTRKRRGLVGRFARSRDGAVAVEFVALALPFSMLVFAILESCISFAGQQVLTTATDNVARQVRTGQIKAAGLNEAVLKQKICDQIEIIVAAGCPGLEVDLREFATFEEAAKVRIKLTADKDIDTSDFDVDPGPSLSKNMLRVFYRWPVMTDFMRKSMSNLKDGKTLHFATATWQNEPFDD
ncbi:MULTISPECIES: TadE/TadG family type IV pilus assembly protein [Nitratireductor]|uniref:TadE/TadG family type IV pilus assembly protein n=1 Tax=Nitratireductor TaxID=245876 RepID=UPI000D0DA6A5|nr:MULTISPECIES: TadE/TadG family type IV pilus assembly protein [Nitratireductor]PSM16831.1 pilus assembly protein [Nitratireductor sp. StC3]